MSTNVSRSLPMVNERFKTERLLIFLLLTDTRLEFFRRLLR